MVFLPECPNLAGCSFVNCCSEMRKSTSANGFIKTFCKGEQMQECVRKKIASKFGKEFVPENMMPNGFPIPGTDKSKWSKEALEYRKLLK